ncbi:8861_t:CDS:2 [Ambispora gerdemannii]|uniref:8861_t:CDS:1 n=1 Tax=Ambispora gerdemannii TaxID=144530 RepID=A0A9N9CIF1_9GLOM|nr:8861_t:CDS:2 [Ambispora gerdemannii]
MEDTSSPLLQKKMSMKWFLAFPPSNIETKEICESEKTTTKPEMPLKERDTCEALNVFNKNVIQSLGQIASKIEYDFLVCGGAAGIDTHSVYL